MASSDSWDQGSSGPQTGGGQPGSSSKGKLTNSNLNGKGALTDGSSMKGVGKQGGSLKGKGQLKGGGKQGGSLKGKGQVTDGGSLKGSLKDGTDSNSKDFSGKHLASCATPGEKAEPVRFGWDAEGMPVVHTACRLDDSCSDLASSAGGRPCPGTWLGGPEDDDPEMFGTLTSVAEDQRSAAADSSQSGSVPDGGVPSWWRACVQCGLAQYTNHLLLDMGNLTDVSEDNEFLRSDIGQSADWQGQLFAYCFDCALARDMLKGLTLEAQQKYFKSEQKKRWKSRGFILQSKNNMARAWNFRDSREQLEAWRAQEPGEKGSRRSILPEVKLLAMARKIAADISRLDEERRNACIRVHAEWTRNVAAQEQDAADQPSPARPTLNNSSHPVDQPAPSQATQATVAGSRVCARHEGRGSERGAGLCPGLLPHGDIRHKPVLLLPANHLPVFLPGGELGKHPEGPVAKPTVTLLYHQQCRQQH